MVDHRVEDRHIVTDDDEHGIAEQLLVRHTLTGYFHDETLVALPVHTGNDRYVVAVGTHPLDMTEFVGQLFGRWAIRMGATDYQALPGDKYWSHMTEALNRYADADRTGDEERRKFLSKTVAIGYRFGVAKQGSW